MRLKVLAAMSGGVDSATAAARAVDAGHEVTGVHLALSSNPQSYRTGARGCCTLEDARDARRAADVIGIPFYVWDLAEQFHRDVVQDFVDEYARGHTPTPCLRCNEKIKCAAVLDRELDLLVAAQARVGRVTARVLIDEVLHHVPVELLGQIPHVERDADDVGGAAGRPGVLQGAAAARSGPVGAGVSGQREMDAGHVVTGVGGPGGGDSRVDAAGHRGEHAKWSHRVRGYAPAWARRDSVPRSPPPGGPGRLC